jgi:uncharacterized tellurite resistance protein B-like protein
MGLSNLVGQLFYNKKQNQKQLEELYKMVEADGVVHASEEELFDKLAQKHHVSGAMLQKIKNHDLDLDDIAPPKDEHTRFEHLYEMVSMMIVDGKVAWEEKKVCRGFASYLGYKRTDSGCDL